MWSSMAASIGSALSAIAGLARISCCQGLTPSALQPHAPTSRPSTIARPVNLGMLMGESPVSERSVRENQRADLPLQGVPVPEAKALVLPLNAAAAVDEKAGRDALDAEFPGEPTVRVEDDAKARDVLLKEALGVRIGVIYVDRDDDKTVRTQLALHPAHPGKRVPARGAPGCPEIDVHDLPPECGDVEQIGCACRSLRRRCQQGEQN